jgi:hypothetical protein
MINTETDIQSLEMLDTRIVNFVPTTSLYAKSNIRFKGGIQYQNVATQWWYGIGSAAVHLTIKDRNNNVLGEVLGVTSSGFFDIGTFETTSFYIPDYYANTDIVVEARFEGGSAGGETFKSTDYYTIYHVSDICQNVSSHTGECAGIFEAEIPFVPIAAFVAGAIVTGIIIGTKKKRTT